MPGILGQTRDCTRGENSLALRSCRRRSGSGAGIGDGQPSPVGAALLAGDLVAPSAAGLQEDIGGVAAWRRAIAVLVGQGVGAYGVDPLGHRIDLEHVAGRLEA